jgi:hypothetical protein
LCQFVAQINFVSQLTSICEYLRFVDVDSRKQVLRNRMSTLEVPPFVYVPLCSSLNTYHSIIRVCAQEAHAFTTKARVPALMLFEVETHPNGLNAATFLGAMLHEYSERKLLTNPAAVTQNPEKEYLSAKSLAEVSADAAPGPVVAAVDTIFFDEEAHLPAIPCAAGNSDKSKALMNIRMGWKDVDITDGSTDPDSDERGAEQKSLVQPVPIPAVTASSESFHQKSQRVRTASPFGHLSNWKMEGLIAKSNDDVRQEVMNCHPI